jgi:hypothetical protein
MSQLRACASLSHHPGPTLQTHRFSRRVLRLTTNNTLRMSSIMCSMGLCACLLLMLLGSSSCEQQQQPGTAAPNPSLATTHLITATHTRARQGSQDEGPRVNPRTLAHPATSTTGAHARTCPRQGCTANFATLGVTPSQSNCSMHGLMLKMNCAARYDYDVLLFSMLHVAGC